MDAIDLAYAGIASQARLIAAGEVSSHELTELYLRRIERLDRSLGAFRVVCAERALMEADQADARRAAGETRPLLGVPLAVKDEIDVAGEVTTLGTNAYGPPAAQDAEIVRRARAAGAIVLGKTRMPELGAFPWTESPTWGVTRNPWELQRSPGGSSGGSGAAVAAGLVAAALAADGGGSIRFPAAYCGLFGLKTQRGRVPLAPSLDAWHGLVVNGVLTRSVRDSALFYDAIAQGPPDPGAPPVAPSSFVAAIGDDAVNGGPAGDRHEVPPGRAGPETSPGGAGPAGRNSRRLRIAVSTNLPPSPLTRLHEDNDTAVQETARLLEELGHDVAECELDHGALAPAPEFVVRYLSGLHGVAGALAHPERLERRLRALARLGSLATAAMSWARAREAPYAARMNAPLAAHDVLLTPVSPTPAPAIGACEGYGWLRTTLVAAAAVVYVAPWNVTGQPACSVPAGFAADGLPRAVQLVGRPGEEATLLALTAELERERPWSERRPAGFA